MIELTIIDKEFQKDVDKYIKTSSNEFKMAVAEATLKTEKLAKHNAPKDDGNLQKNINSKITQKGFTGEITSGANYSEAVEKGTKPHTIRIKNKQVLAGAYRKRPQGWNVSASSKKLGYATYGKKVQHPGTRPQPFMKPAFDVGRKILMRKIEKVFK